MTIRKLFLIAVIITTAFGVALTQETVVEANALEFFVARPSAVVEVDEPVGSILHTEATRDVALLVAGSTRQRARKFRRRELRVDPTTSTAGQDRLYLDQAQAAATISNLAGIEAGIADLKSGTAAPYRMQGTTRCWRLTRPARILCPSYGVGPDGSGLWLDAYGGTGFSFP